MLHFIYELIDPRDEQCRYVGITINPNLRFRQHLAGDSNHEKKAWLLSLQGEEIEPRMSIIEIVDDMEKAQEQEKYWVQYRIDEGCLLTNIALVPPLPQEILTAVGVNKKKPRTNSVEPISETLESISQDWKEVNPEHYMSRYDATRYCRLGMNGEMRFIQLSGLINVRKCEISGYMHYHKDDVRDFAEWIEQFYPELIRRPSSDGGE